MDFEFLFGSALTNLELTEVKRFANSLAVKYNKDLNPSEFCLDLESKIYCLTWNEQQLMIIALSVHPFVRTQQPQND
jgi:hypothetical protein